MKIKDGFILKEIAGELLLSVGDIYDFSAQ